MMHTQSILCATVDSQCLEYLGCITLSRSTSALKPKATNVKDELGLAVTFTSLELTCP